MIGNKFPGQRRKDIILVPLWIAQRLIARQLGERDVVDFNRISRFLSPNDLAGLLALQDKADYIVGKLSPRVSRPTPAIGKCAYTSQSALFDYWQASALTEDQRTLLGSIFKLAQLNDVSNDVVERLFSHDQGQSAQSLSQLSEEQPPYVINDVDTDLCIMTIRPGYFDANSVEGKKLQVRALEAILQSFYRTVPAHEVSRTVWFTRYLETLSAA